jgi:hypothetical protein
MGTIYYKQEQKYFKGSWDHGFLGSPRHTRRNKAIRAGLTAALFCHFTESHWTQEGSDCLWTHSTTTAFPMAMSQAARLGKGVLLISNIPPFVFFLHFLN